MRSQPSRPRPSQRTPTVTTRHVLIITSALPPSFHGGTPRLLRWCRVLPELGWRVSLCGFSGNPLLKDQDPAPEGVKLTGVNVGRLWDRIGMRLAVMGSRPGVAGSLGRAASSLMGLPAPGGTFPDQLLVHIPRLARAAVRTIQRDRPDAVMVTVPSFSLLQPEFLRALKSAAKGAVVIDARDHLRDFEQWEHDPAASQKALKLQSEAAAMDVGISAVTGAIAAEWKECGHSGPSRVVFNSFLREALDNQAAWPGRKEGIFRITYTGMTYDSSQPKFLLPGARMLAERDPEFARAFRFRFVGRKTDSHMGDWDGELPGVLETMDQIPYSEAKRIMRESDVLLTVKRSKEVNAVIPGGKIYEYMGARRPVLALSSGMAGDLAEDLKIGVRAEPENPESVAQALAGLFALWQSNSPFPFGPVELLDPYETRTTARQLIGLFEAASGKTP